MPDQFTLKLPDLNLRSLIGGKDLGRIGLELLTGQRSAGSVAMHVGYGLLGQLLDRSLPNEANMAAGQLAEWMRQGRARWEAWLRGAPQYTVAIIGGKGEGKTTCAFDIMDRFIAPTGRALYTFGVPQEVLPPGIHELSILKLRQMGERLRANPDVAGLEIAKLFRLRDHPEGFAILLDDASIYLNAKAHQKPESLALQTIVNVARHFRGIVLATFQNSRDVGRSLVEVDALVASRPNMLMMGPSVIGMGDERDEPHTSERDEIRPWMDKAAAALAGLTGDDAILTKYVACFDRNVMWAGTWTHRRPAFYDETLSRNKAVVPDYEDDDVIDGDFRESPSASGRFYCAKHRAVHWTASRQGQECVAEARSLDGDVMEVKG